MPLYRADLHMHTLLSPCGDLEMTPCHIVEIAKSKGLDMIAVTDHNCTLQAPEVKRVGEQHGLFVLCGAEVTTKEEVHCVCLMPDFDSLSAFQQYLDAHLPHIANKPDFFGYQLWVNEEEEVQGEQEWLLISALDQDINEVEAMVHSLGGLFIPAHIDKQRDSLLSQLGFVPFDLNYDALELSKRTTVEQFVQQQKYLRGAKFVQSSDAHFPSDIGAVSTVLEMDDLSFNSFAKAIHTK